MENRTRQHEVTEKELMEALARGPSNPEPDDSCLNAESLQLLADGRMEDEAERLKALSHFAGCHHCASALAELRRKSQPRGLDQPRWPIRRLRRIFAFAFAAIFLIATAVWIVQRPSGNSNSSNDVGIADLRDDVTRGVDNPPVRISRTTKHLKIILPVGSPIGRYDVEVFGVDRRTILHSSGLSRPSNITAELLVDLDFRSVAPGQYNLAIRHGDLQMEFHPILVE